MAKDSDYIKKTDLETVIQRVRIENQEQEVKIANASDIAQPLIEEDKKKSLKEIEDKLEERSLFQDMAKGISSLKEATINGFSNLTNSLIDKGKSIFTFIRNVVGVIAGIFLGLPALVAGFLKQLRVELYALLRRALPEPKKLRFATFLQPFTRLIDFLKKIKNISFLKNLNIKPISQLFSSIGRIFKSISDFVTKSKGFRTVVGFFGKIGRLLGRIFLPITILFAVFDFVKGFMKGYKEDGIIGGITEGIVAVFDGLVGGLLRLLAWIPKKIFELFGLDNLAAAIMPALENTLDAIKNTFRGLVDIVVGIFTLNPDKLKKGFSKIILGILNSFLGNFRLLSALVKDVFGGGIIDKIKTSLKKIGLAIMSFFLYLRQGIFDLLDKIPDVVLPKSAERWIDKNVKENAKLKNEIDAQRAEINKSIEAQRRDRLRNERAEQTAKIVTPQPKQLGKTYTTAAVGAGSVVQAPTANTRTNTNVSNNVSYNIQGNTNLASDALNFATGSATGFYAPAR